MQKKTLKLLDGIILVLVILFTNQFIPVCYMLEFFQPRLCEVGLAQWQLFFILIVVLAIFGLIRYRNNQKAFSVIWQKNWLIEAFVCLALFSNLWSVLLPITILRSALLFLLAFVAAYFGLRFTDRNLVNFIAITIGVFALTSLLIGIFLPSIAIMSNRPYEGLWRGIFWHKIYLGAAMALGYIAYLTILFSSRQQYSSIQKLLAALMLGICTMLAILSDSASGLVMFTIQTGLFIVLLLWLSWGHLINRKTYVIIGAFTVIVFLLATLNLDFIFGLFNRSATMTGRVPLWLHLLKTYVAERPLLGYGIGTFWYQPDMPEKIQTVVKWGYAVGVSDNGYMDVVLGLGVPGLMLFLGILVKGLWHNFRSSIWKRDLVSFFPFLVLIHIVFINISLSYFMESESFIWFLLALTLFTTSRRDTKNLPG